MAKADGMLTILRLLQGGGRRTAPELAEKLEVSVRTVYRYIDSLCASGVPIIADTGPTGGYSLPAGFRDKPLFFSKEQVVALFQAATLAQASRPPNPAALEEALDRLHLHLPPAQAAAIAR